MLEETAPILAALVHAPPGDELPEDDADREHIGPRIDALVAGVLGAHVPGLALQSVVERLHGRIARERVVRAGDAEVADLHFAVEGEEQVRRRYVAVHDTERLALVTPQAMGVVETAKRLADDVERELERQRDLRARAPAEKIVEVETLDVIHGDEQPAFFTPEVEHLHDVGVVQARGELRLVHEHVAEPRVAGEAPEDLFDHAQPTPAELDRLARKVDLGHPALADAVEQHVPPESVAAERRNARLETFEPRPPTISEPCARSTKATSPVRRTPPDGRRARVLRGARATGASRRRRRPHARRAPSCRCPWP